MSDRFRARQRRYWETKKRFADPRDAAPTAFVVPKLDWALQHMHVDRATAVLDVGAGNGTFTWHWHERVDRVVGIDFSRNLLRRSPLPERMVQADVASLPFRDQQFDVVAEGNMLHHSTDPSLVLHEMARVSRRHLLLVEPNRRHLPMSVFMAANRSERRGLRYDASFLTQLAQATGLRVIAIAPQGAIYPNQTPERLLRPLARFDRPSRLGAYIVAVLEKQDGAGTVPVAR